MSLPRSKSDGHFDSYKDKVLPNPPLNKLAILSEKLPDLLPHSLPKAPTLVDTDSISDDLLLYGSTNSSSPSPTKNKPISKVSPRFIRLGPTRRHSLDFTILTSDTSPRTPRSPLSSGRRYTRSSVSPPLTSRPNNRISVDLNLEKIQLHALLGAGSASHVYRGSIMDIGFSLAIKLLRIEAFTPEEIRNIEKEIRLLEVLSHPNVIHIMGYRKSLKGDTLSIFLPLYDRSLRVHIDEFFPFSLEQITYFALECAYGLYYLHSQIPPIIHRDLKSENVLIQDVYQSDKPNVVISDFGEAVFKLKKQKMESNAGTTEFRAPELITDTMTGIKYDEKIDIWSFGMLLYELMIGDIPYHDRRNSRDIPDYTKIIDQIKLGNRPILNLTEDREVEFSQIIGIFNDCTQLKSSRRPSSSCLVKKLLKVQNK